MDAGPRGEITAAVPWRRATLTWMLIMLVETGHGAVREIFIAPEIGALRARQFGVLVGSLLVLVIAWLTARWLGADSRRAQLRVGVLWVALTLLFELALGRALSASWDRILEDYNVSRGGLMMLGLAVMLFAPMLAAHLRAGNRKESS